MYVCTVGRDGEGREKQAGKGGGMEKGMRTRVVREEGGEGRGEGGREMRRAICASPHTHARVTHHTSCITHTSSSYYTHTHTHITHISHISHTYHTHITHISHTYHTL
jgi:hypothetical protein